MTLRVSRSPVRLLSLGSAKPRGSPSPEQPPFATHAGASVVPVTQMLRLLMRDFPVGAPQQPQHAMRTGGQFLGSPKASRNSSGEWTVSPRFPAGIPAILSSGRHKSSGVSQYSTE